MGQPGASLEARGGDAEPATSPATTLADCEDKPIYDAETKDVKDDRSLNTTMIAQRRAAAMKAVFGFSKGTIEKLVAHDGGRTPRPFVSLADEDAACGGHSAERHILGQGDMPTHREVALRAAFWKVNGKRMDLDALGIASVFQDEATATAAVKAAIAAEITPNGRRRTSPRSPRARRSRSASQSRSRPWPTRRSTAPRARHTPTRRCRPTWTRQARTARAVPRRLQGRADGPGRPDKTQPALTAGGATVQGTLYMIIDPSPTYATGWAIYTAYPRP